jgi:hypothetical protein
MKNVDHKSELVKTYRTKDLKHVNDSGKKRKSVGEGEIITGPAQGYLVP